MPSNSRRINIYQKRLLSLAAIGEHFFDFLDDEINEVTSAIFQGAAGVLDADEIEITATVADTFTLDITNASRGVVTTGEIIDISLLASALYTQVPFENLTGKTYNVGLKFMEWPDAMEINPRSGDPEYRSYKQTYGEQDEPSFIADLGASIRLTLANIAQTGEDHSGRAVRVWLVDPVSGVDSIAFFEGTIVYGVPDNYVDIPYSGGDGPLGQDTDAGPPSTTVGDYVAAVEGPSVRDKAIKDYSADAAYIYIGDITGLTGGIPVGFNISGQSPIFVNTLDRAYDGAAGAGAGRLIIVDAEAVELRSRSGMTDELGGALRIDRKTDSYDGGSCLQLIIDEDRGAGALHLRPLKSAAGGMIIDNPASSTNPDIVTRTAAVNWVTSNVNPRCDLAWLQGFATIDGLYYIIAVAATTLQLRLMSAVAPTFPGAETGNVTILRLTQSTTALIMGGALNPLLHGYGGTSFAGDNVPIAPAPLTGGGEDIHAAATFYGDQTDEAHFLESDPVSPVVHSWVDNEGIFKTQVGLDIKPNRLITVVPVGLRLFADAYGGLNWTPSAVDRLVVISDPASVDSVVVEPSGRRAEPHVFKDDFHYNATNWVDSSTCPYEYRSTVGGWGIAFQGGNGTLGHGGHALLRATAGAGDTVTLEGGLNWWLDTNVVEPLLYMSRVAASYAPATIATRIERHGLIDNVGNYAIQFEHDFVAHGNNNWWLVVRDGANPLESVDTGIGFAYDGGNNEQFLNFYFTIIDATHIDYWVQGMGAEAQMTLALISFSGAGVAVRLEAFEGNSAAAVAELYLDYWELRDTDALSGAQGSQVY